MGTSVPYTFRNIFLRATFHRLEVIKLSNMLLKVTQGHSK